MRFCNPIACSQNKYAANFSRAATRVFATRLPTARTPYKNRNARQEELSKSAGARDARRRRRQAFFKKFLRASSPVRRSTRDECADFFPEHNPPQIVRFEEIKNDDRHLVVHAEREGGVVHHGQLADERVLVGDLREAFGLRVFLR